MRRRIPQPPTNPPEPSPSSSEHEFRHPYFDEDGVGADAAEELDEPLIAVYETHSCARGGCDAQRRYEHSFDYTDGDSRTQQIICETVRRSGVYSDAAQYATEHAEMIDYDDGPVVAIRVGDEKIGYIYPSLTNDMSDSGPCYGHVDEATRLGI